MTYGGVGVNSQNVFTMKVFGAIFVVISTFILLICTRGNIE